MFSNPCLALSRPEAVSATLDILGHNASGESMVLKQTTGKAVKASVGDK